MAAVFSTVAGYGSGAINADGSLLVDTEDGINTVFPSFGPDGTTIVPVVVSPSTIGTNMPVMNAILAELRVITELLMIDLGTLAPDVRALRAEFGFNSLPVTGQA